MIISYSEVSDELKDEVCFLFSKKHNFDYIKKRYPELEHNVIFSILYASRRYHQYIYYNLNQVKMHDKKIAIISDTHYGSLYENLRYAYDVFDFASKNNIKTIWHGGDLIESYFKAKSEFDLIDQAQRFIDNYPSDKSIKTYAILGNHDYAAINDEAIVRQILSSRKDVKILGFRKAYFKWLKYTVSLDHLIDRFKIAYPPSPEDIGFKGHSHFYRVKTDETISERINIPALCDDPFKYSWDDNIAVKPGFLTAEIDNNIMLIEHYSFINQNIVKEDEYIKLLRVKK